MSNAPRTVLVTGAAGFLGSHLVERHLLEGDIVYGIDNFSTSNSNAHKFVDLFNHPNFLFSAGDVCDRYEVEGLFEYGLDVGPARFDLVYNFACPASPPKYQSMPTETLLACTQGFANILKAARANNPNVVIVHASTSEVYGDPERRLQGETYRGRVNCYGPRACYDEGKRAAEALAFDYLNKHGLDVRLVRIFNTYGPGMDPNDGRIVTSFIRSALLNEPLTVHGDGQQSRSMCYVDDLIERIVRMGKLLDNPRMPINIGNDREFAVIDIAKMIIELAGSKSEIVFVPRPIDDPTTRRPRLALARKLLADDAPEKVELREGLMRTVEWFRSRGV